MKKNFDQSVPMAPEKSHGPRWKPSKWKKSKKQKICFSIVAHTEIAHVAMHMPRCLTDAHVLHNTQVDTVLSVCPVCGQTMLMEICIYRFALGERKRYVRFQIRFSWVGNKEVLNESVFIFEKSNGQLIIIVVVVEITQTSREKYWKRGRNREQNVILMARSISFTSSTCFVNLFLSRTNAFAELLSNAHSDESAIDLIWLKIWCQTNATQKSNAIFFTLMLAENLKVFFRDATQFLVDFCLIFLTRFRDHVTFCQFCFSKLILATPNARYTSGYRSPVVNGLPNTYRHWNATENKTQEILWKIVKFSRAREAIILCFLRSILFLLTCLSSPFAAIWLADFFFSCSFVSSSPRLFVFSFPQ